jgi:hypothetical protein
MTAVIIFGAPFKSKRAQQESSEKPIEQEIIGEVPLAPFPVVAPRFVDTSPCEYIAPDQDGA